MERPDVQFSIFWKDSSSSFFFPHEGGGHGWKDGRCLAGVRSKGYRFGMCVGGCWPTPTPILVLRTTFWGASYPNPDIRSAGKQLLPSRKLRPPHPLEYGNPRQERGSIEATLAKTNPGSTLQPTVSHRSFHHHDYHPLLRLLPLPKRRGRKKSKVVERGWHCGRERGSRILWKIVLYVYYCS